MSAQKFTRKQLKQDGFVAWTERALEYVQRNYVFLGLAVLALIVVFVGASWYRQSRANAHLEASRLLFAGQTAIAEGAYGDAQVMLRNCIDDYGGSEFAPIARIELARALHGMGESEAAIVAADEALATLPPGDPLVVNAQLVKAAILSDLERYDAAIGVYRDILADPQLSGRQRVDVTHRLADSYEHAGRPGDAQRVYAELKAAIEAGEVPGNPRSLDSRLEYYRALAKR